MDPEILARILKLSETLAVCRYVNTAGAAAWFYDFILTISTEHKYIWKRKWSLVKALYLIVRLTNLASRCISPHQSSKRTVTLPHHS